VTGVHDDTNPVPLLQRSRGFARGTNGAALGAVLEVARRDGRAGGQSRRSGPIGQPVPVIGPVSGRG